MRLLRDFPRGSLLVALTGLFVGAVGLWAPAGSQAACNLIPQTTKAFRATLGVADRPYGIPGEWVSLHLDPICDGASSGFTANAADHVVTIVFRPPAGPVNVVALSTNCTAVESQRAACEATPDVAAATCMSVSAGSPPLGLAVQDKDGTRYLRFRFPDTEALVGTPSDGRTLSGPAAVAVTTTSDPLPCGLATASCAETPGLLSCVDSLYESDGSCGAAAHRVFPHFTALPQPNDYQAVCSPPLPCTESFGEVRLATDSDGNLLIPVDWRGILVRKQDVPVPRLLRAATSIEAFSGTAAPIRLPSGAFVDSYTPEGGLLPPIFDPQTDPDAPNEFVLFGSADAPETVLRVARRSPKFRECWGGTRDELPCTKDADCEGGSCVATTCKGGTNDRLTCTANNDCPGGECGGGLFELRDRLSDGGVGPVVVSRVASGGGGGFVAGIVDPRSLQRRGVCESGPKQGQTCPPADCTPAQCVDYRIEAQSPVPLDGIAETTDLYGFVIDESIESVDLNGDYDTRDYVIELRDRDTGERLPVAVAVSRTHRPPFGYPALAVEGNVAALLEPDAPVDDCPPPPICDMNADGDYLDTFLRVYRDDYCCDLSGGSVAAEAAPAIGGQSVVLSNGLVFYRRTEWMDTPQMTTKVSIDSAGVEGQLGSGNSSISQDGQHVAFDSQAYNLVTGDGNAAYDVFVRDVIAGTTERVSVDSFGTEGNAYSAIPSISADGRYVVFQSDASNLVAGDTNVVTDVFVHDRVTHSTQRVSVDLLGGDADGASNNPSISADGRFVSFASDATDLVAGDTNLAPDVFVRDLQSGTTERISIDSAENEANAGSDTNDISANGRYVVFASAATNLVAGDTNGFIDFFLRDRDLGLTERVSVAADSSEGNDNVYFSPRVSDDGRFVAFVSSASNLVPGHGTFTGVYLRDRLLETTSAVHVDSAGIDANGPPFSTDISGDGRYVVFQSSATNLVDGGDAFPSTDVYLHDTVTGRTELLNVDDSAVQADGGFKPALSPDGRFVSFGSSATTLVPGGSNGQSQIYVRGLDPADLTADLTGDGDVETTVLEVLDATSGPSATRTTLCPASSAVVAAGQTAYLRPEDAGPTPSLLDCPTAALIGGDPDLSGDGDAEDEVVHFWSTSEGASRNLGLAASELAISASWIGVLASECAEAGGTTTGCSGGGTDLNGDGDAGDQVLEVHEVCSPISSCSWTQPTVLGAGQAGDDLDIVGSVAAIITSEQDQGGQNLNGGVGSPEDTDADDRVLQVYDASTGVMTNVRQAAAEFVLGEEATSCDGLGTLQLVAFRTSEQAQGGQNLNGGGSPPDVDADDDVLQVYDAKSDTPAVSTGQAVTPCRLEACDPRWPYRVSGHHVKFLTYEPDQGIDLDGDGSATGLVLQSFDYCTATTVTLSAVSESAGAEVDPLAGSSGGETSPGATEGETLLVEAGRCLEPIAGCATNADCNGTAFCDVNVCKAEHGVCVSNADCAPGAVCEPDLVVATDTDADLDGVPDAADNCPEVANDTQEQSLGGEVGDACVSAVCGNNLSESIEECDGTDDAACPGACLSDCSCACSNVPTDPKAKVVIKAKKDRGVMTGKMAIQLGSYDGEAVAVRLDDTNSVPIALEALANLPARGRSGKKWLYKQRDDGIRKMLLKDRTKKNPGEFLIVVKSKRWFTAAAADQAAALTDFTVAIGAQCFRHPATKKVD